MKTIVVPTDFSAAAENALKYAAQLAKKINGRILLLHVYQIPISMNDMPVLTVSADEIKTNAEVALDTAQQSILKDYPGLEIATDTRLGDVSDELNELCKSTSVFAIVVGKQGLSGVERVLFGSTTLSVIRHCNMPVIAVPENATFRLSNAALAIDLLGGSDLPQDRIGGLLKDLGVQLHIVHVKTRNEGDTSAELKKVLPGLQPVYHNIADENFVHGIKTFIEEKHIDLLITIPHRHTLIERLFFKTHTSELIEEVQIPIMSIREK